MPHLFLLIVILFGADGKLAGIKTVGAADSLASCWNADVAFIEAHKSELPKGYTARPYCAKVPPTIEAYNAEFGEDDHG